MTRDEIRTQISGALTSVAPEIDPASLTPSAALRDQVDLDSMDFLRFVMELHRRFGVDVPEADYQKLSTLNDVIDYLTAHLGASAGMPPRVAERRE